MPATVKQSKAPIKVGEEVVLSDGEIELVPPSTAAAAKPKKVVRKSEPLHTLESIGRIVEDIQSELKVLRQRSDDYLEFHKDLLVQFHLRLTKMALLSDEPAKPKARRSTPKKKADIVEITESPQIEPEPYEKTDLTFGEFTLDEHEPPRVATPPRDIPKKAPRPASARE